MPAIGERFDAEGHPRNLTTLHPIAAGDMYGIKGIDHLAKPGLLKQHAVRLLSVRPVLVRAAADLEDDRRQFGRRLQCAVRHPVRHASRGRRQAAGRADQGRPRHLRRPAPPGLRHERGRQRADRFGRSSSTARNGSISGRSCPHVSIIRATTADERGNLTYEHEGAYLGGLEQALAARNNGGIVIAQVKRVVENGTLKPHDVRVPGMLVDYIVVAPDQLQTTQTPYDPAISGEIFRPLSTLPHAGVEHPEGDRAPRRAWSLRDGMAVNIGFGISANVPRILLEEGQHGKVTWVIEQGAVGGVPLLDFKFGCASNADAFMPSPHQFIYFQAGGFDASLLSFLQIDRDGSVNVSKLSARPHVTAGAGGFVDITARAKKIVFSGFFNAGAKLSLADGGLRIDQEGKVKKVVDEVEHISFSGKRAVAQGQDITYVTERCVMKLTPDGLVVTEIAPGVDLAARRAGAGGIPARRRQRPEGDAGSVSIRDAPIGLSLEWRRLAGGRMADRSSPSSSDGAIGTITLAPAGKIQRARHPDAASAGSGTRRGRSCGRRARRAAARRGQGLLRRRRCRGLVGDERRRFPGANGCATAIASSTGWRGCASRRSPCCPAMRWAAGWNWPPPAISASPKRR